MIRMVFHQDLEGIAGCDWSFIEVVFTCFSLGDQQEDWLVPFQERLLATGRVTGWMVPVIGDRVARVLLLPIKP